MYKPGESGNLKGRPPGSENKSAKVVREAFARLIESNLDNMSIWLDQVAKKNPGQAIELITKLSEFCLPKLARQEMVGAHGEDLFQNIKFSFNTVTNGKESESAPQESASMEDSPGPTSVSTSESGLGQHGPIQTGL